MPTFPTPDPISVAIELVIGDARITATERVDTIVEVRPSDSAAEIDVRAAEQTRVEYTEGRLVVTAPKQRGFGLFRKVGSVDVTIAVPAGSNVQGDAAVATFRSTGRLGECRIRTGTGDIHFDQTGTLDLHTAGGAIVVDRVAGHAGVSNGSGTVRLHDVTGTAVIKNSNGDSWVGTVTGDLRARAANGDIIVDQARAGVTATTANGDVRIGEVRRGAVSIRTSCGELEVGIKAGVAALLDVHTQFGNIHNGLTESGAPPQQDDAVEVRARTSYGDIVIRRC